MVDGAGQVVNTLVRGRFFFEHNSAVEYNVRFTEVIEIDPYYKLKRFRGVELDAYLKATEGDVPLEEQDILRRLEAFSAYFTREAGPFLIRKQIIWNIRDAEEWPYLLFPERYRFEPDLLAAFAANQDRNLYYRVESPVMDANVYYRRQDAQELTAREVAERGIAPKSGTGTAS